MTFRLLWSDISAAIGGFVWLLFVLLAPRTSAGLLLTIENLLLMAILVHVPLALGLLYHPGDPVWGSDPIHFAVRLQPFAAVCVWIALTLPFGKWSAVFCLPWLVMSLTLAVTVLFWLGNHEQWLAHQLAFCAAMLYLPIGVAWLIAYRFGWRPLGFADVIVVLTGVHFHFTGFVLPVITGLVGAHWKIGMLDRDLPGQQHLAGRSPTVSGTNTQHAIRNTLYAATTAGIILAPPLIAAGITLSPLFEVLGVGLIFLSACGLVALTIGWVAIEQASTVVRTLLMISALSLLVAISLALIYGLGEYFERQWLTIPQMVALHGWSNALGFGLCGLLAWRLSHPPKVAEAKQLLEQTW